VLIRSARGLRIGGLLVGSAAAVLAAVVGCTSVTGGHGGVNAEDAPAYRTSMSVSVSESAASSSARESEHQASLTTQAMHDTCETLSTSSADAIDAVNAYVSAFNSGASDVSGTEDPAVNALNKSADAVAGSVTDAIPDQLKTGLPGLGRRCPPHSTGDHRARGARRLQPDHPRPQRHQVECAELVRRDVLIPTAGRVIAGVVRR
jgi:hypothetical protein